MTNELIYNLLVFIPAVLIGVSVHESAHGLAAFWLGDDTAREEGRITLNPVKHITWVTVVFAVIAALPFTSIFIPFKPVPVNHARLDDPRWGPGLTAIAGPLSNLLLGLAVAFLGRLLLLFLPLYENFTGQVANYIASFCLVQFMLFFFNILPIPPLDGHWVLGAVFPAVDRIFRPLRRNFTGFFILLITLQIPVVRNVFSRFAAVSVNLVGNILTMGM